MNDKPRTLKGKRARCKFYAMCGNMSDMWAHHTHIGRCAVCYKCYETNEYIVRMKRRPIITRNYL